MALHRPTSNNEIYGCRNSSVISSAAFHCRPGFDYQTHHIFFIIYSQMCAIFVLATWEKNESKQKETGFGPFFTNNEILYLVRGSSLFSWFSRCFNYNIRVLLSATKDLPNEAFRYATISVTSVGDLLHFGQLFKACGSNYFAQIAHIFRQFL